MNGDKIGWLDDKMSELLLDDKITCTDFSNYIDKMQWLSFSISKFLNASLTTNMIIPPDNVIKRKKELIEKNKDAIKNGDVTKVVEIENELIELSKKAVKDLPDYQIYESGSRGSFKNNYKNTSLMRGAIKNLDDPTKIMVSTSSLEEGIPPEELHSYAEILNNASYSRAISTADGG